MPEYDRYIYLGTGHTDLGSSRDESSFESLYTKEDLQRLGIRIETEPDEKDEKKEIMRFTPDQIRTLLSSDRKKEARLIYLLVQDLNTSRTILEFKKESLQTYGTRAGFPEAKKRQLTDEIDYYEKKLNGQFALVKSIMKSYNNQDLQRQKQEIRLLRGETERNDEEKQIEFLADRVEEWTQLAIAVEGPRERE